MDITVWEWFEQRSFHYRDFRGLTEGADRLPLTTTLVLPTRNTAETIGPILDTVARLNDRTGLIEQVVVVDADSRDGTADIARRHGAEVYSENELLPEYGRAHGKGDAMWRSLSVARGDIVMFADSDSTDFAEHFVYGTLGPLLTDPEVQFSKAAVRAPVRLARAAAHRPGGPVQQGGVPAAVQLGRKGGRGRGRPGHRADGQAPAELLLSRADRVRAAAGRGVRRPPRAAVRHPVRHRVRRRDRDDGRRAERGRPGRHGPGRPGDPPEPAPAVVRPDPDELGGAARAGPPVAPGRPGRGGPRPVGNAGPAATGRLPARGGHRRRPAAGRASGRAARPAAAGPRAGHRGGTRDRGLSAADATARPRAGATAQRTAGYAWIPRAQVQ